MADKKIPVLTGLTSVAPLSNPIVISDLDLVGSKPKTIMAFLRFMKSHAPRYTELVILGNLFDHWTGDDTMKEAAPIVAQLKHYVSTGHRVVILRGHHDFLMSEDFARSCGAELLLGPTVIRVMDTDILFAHGDEWCIRDLAYQRWRETVLDPRWQEAVLSSPIEERLEMIHYEQDIREAEAANPDPLSQTGIIESAVAEAARSAGVDRVIHGHTHRPGAHINAIIERWSLPNWDFDNEETHSSKSGWITFRRPGLPQIQLF